jgi:topoisomerase-4 subunit B
MEPVFESQTKTKLGSADMGSEVGMPSVRTFINDFVKTKLDNYLHKNTATADAFLRKILQAERKNCPAFEN